MIKYFWGNDERNWNADLPFKSKIKRLSLIILKKDLTSYNKNESRYTISGMLQSKHNY